MKRPSRLAICVGISALLLFLLGTSLGGAHPPWKTTIASHVRPGTSALLDSHAARFHHRPALLSRRAVSRRHRGGSGPIGKDQAPQSALPLEPAAEPSTPSSPISQPSTPASPPRPPAQPGAVDPPTEPEPEPPAEPGPPAEPPADPTPPSEPGPEPPSEPEPAEPGPAPEPEPAPPAPSPKPPDVEPAKPVPPQPQAPEPPSSLPLFDGDQIGDFANVQAAPNAITEVADPLGSGETVFRMTVDDGDVAPVTPTENPRAQALSPDLINAGDEIWLATKFMLPQGFPATVPGWLSLVEIYGEPFAGPSPWGIGIAGDEFSWERNDSYGYDVPWRMPLVRDRWVHLLLHERFAADGWVEMWIDGQRVTFFPGGSKSTQRLQMATRDSSNDGGPNAAKIMNYRKVGMFETATVYFGALKIGETQASVGG